MVSKKKVLINASMYSSNPSGVGIHIREVVRRLAAAGDRFDFECFSYVPIQTEGLTVNLISLPPGLDLLKKRFKAIHRLIWNLFFLPRIARRFDMIYSGSSHGTPFFSKQIITIHDLISLRVTGQYPAQRFYFKYILPFIVRSSERVLVISEFTRDDVLDAYNLEPDKVVVNPNGGDHLRLGSTYVGMPEDISEIIKGRPYFLAVGASYPNKNIERLIEAFLSVEHDCCLVITGISSSYGRRIKRKNRNNSKLIFLDFVSDEALSALYRGACANVYVSLYEGFGFPPYEAAANGTVSIVSDIASLREIYDNSVHYVDPLSVEDISWALKGFLEGRVDLASYRNEFSELLERYTWEKTAAKIIETIDGTNTRHE